MWGLRNIVTKDRRAQLHPDRVLYPMVRRPGSKTWERLSWDQAALEIARHVKKTRDATFVEKEGDVTVNRCDGIASLGARPAQQRGRLARAEVCAKPRRGRNRQPDPRLPLLDRFGPCADVRPRLHDEPLVRLRKLRRHHDDRLEQRRKPSALLPLGRARPGQGRHVDRHRPALLPLGRPRRPLRPHPSGRRPRLLRRPDQLHPAERPLSEGIRPALHERRLPAAPRLQVRRRPRPLLRLGSGNEALRQ